MFMVTEADRILEKHGIDPNDIEADVDIDFVVRHVPGMPSTSQPTLMIEAPWREDSEDTWPRVVRELKESIDNRVQASGSTIDIAVEMLAPELTRAKYLDVVEHIPQLKEAWPDIQDQVYEILESFDSTSGDMTAIGLFRLGYSEYSNNNPITIYISMDYNSPENCWPPVIRQIEAYLDGLDLGDLSHKLTVHMEHNIVEGYGFELHEPTEPAGYLVIDENYKTTVDLGDDISAATYLTRNDGKVCNPALGTVGCYLEILPRDSSTWERVVLTNYHVVRPCFQGFEIETALPSQRHHEGDSEVPGGASVDQHAASSSIAIPDDDSQLWHTDWHGFGPDIAPQPLHIESPSRPKHNATVRALKNAMESGLPLPPELIGLDTQHGGPDLDLVDAELKSKLEFFDTGKHVFGSLLYGSGFNRRSQRNQRLDWALIRVPAERRGTNDLPSLPSWNKAYASRNRHPEPVGCSTNLRPQGQASLWKMEVGDKAFKVGARTKQTAGYYSEFKSKCKVKHDRHLQTIPSSEFVFVGYTGSSGSTFADCGDSGAVVFNAFGQLIGLAFTGQSPQGANKGYTLVTPIEDVFEDIKAMSKGEIVDVRVAQ